MTKRDELQSRYLFTNEEIVFDIVNDISLIFTVDLFNEHIIWEVKEQEHYITFDDFEEALNYYLKVIS